MTHTRAAHLIMVVVVAAACNSGYGYYSTPITAINETGSHRAASITFSEPQIFSRESLLNHRLAEVEHLRKQLAESVTQTFSPQLHRDLSAISVLNAQLGVAFNPTLGAINQRGQDVAELQNKIDLNTLRAQLLQV